MARLVISGDLGSRDTERVKYERYKIGIEGSIGLYWIRTARQRPHYLYSPPYQRKGQGILFQLHAVTGLLPAHLRVLVIYRTS